MKKLLSLLLAICMLAALAVPSFAATTPTNNGATPINLETGKATIIIVAKDTVLASKNGFTTVEKMATVNNEDYYLVKANATDVVRTEILTTKVGTADADDAYYLNITLPAPAPVVNPIVAGVDKITVGGSYVEIDMTSYYVDVACGECDECVWDYDCTAPVAAEVTPVGISADAYNLAKNLGKEKIIITMDAGVVVLYRGDYTKKNIDKDILIDVTVGSWEIDDGLHNDVLAALGNDKVDPLYINVAENDLNKVASKPEMKIWLGEVLSINWLEDNGTSGLTLMKYTAKTDDAAASVAVVAEGLALDSIQNKYLTLSLTEAGTYFLLPAADAVVPEAPADDETEEKPNAGTGANDLAAAAIAFAVIAIAAGVSKKVK